MASFADLPSVVAVFSMDGADAHLSKKSTDKLTEYLAARLTETGSFLVIPTSQIRQRIEQQKAESYSACYDEACQIEIGKELAAQKAISTKVIQLGTHCVVTAGLFDLRRAVVERSATREGGCGEEDVASALHAIATELAAPKRGRREDPPPMRDSIAPATRRQSNLVGATPEGLALRGSVGFVYNKSVFVHRSLSLLAEVAAVLLQFPERRVEIQGHTEPLQDKRFALELSQARADAVRQYLTNKGIPPERLVARGYGDTLPLVPNRTISDFEINRRIEFRWIPTEGTR